MDREGLYNKIIDTLKAGGAVQILTALRAWQVDKRHVDFFKLTDNGLYMRNGKRWDCIDHCQFRFGMPR